MIRHLAVLHILGLFMLVFAATMLVPILLGISLGWDGLPPLYGALAITTVCGAALWLTLPRPKTELSPKEGILLTVLIWSGLSLFGALPFAFSPQFPAFTDAVFEAVSGFTTTGATILPEVEPLAPAVQFWRHFAHWLGGMGIVVLGVAVLPLIGAGGMALYRAEFSGARSEKLKPRIAETALALWRIYFALTLAQYLLLRLAGLDWFDAICHTFSTLGTGGFSTRTASVGGFNSPAVEIIIIVFMILAGMNFTLHYRLWRGGEVRHFLRDPEIRGYLGIIGGAGLVVTATLLLTSGMSAGTALRAAFFQVASIATTTGFATVDYETWAPVTHTILLALMFIGGCTGSTAGGWKVARVLLMERLVRRELRKTSERRGVFAVRLGDQVVPEATLQTLLNLVYLSLLIYLAAVLAVSATGADLLTSLSGVAAAMFSVGPGFGTVGPAENYAHLPLLAKWVLIFCMVAGRLEFYTAIVVLTPGFWKR
jgi:trk system potassium uptake protein TrkH